MSTQQSAKDKTPEQRAEEYLFTPEYDNEDKPKHIAMTAFLAGRADYEKELSEKAGELVKEWLSKEPIGGEPEGDYRNEIERQFCIGFARGFREGAEDCHKALALPLLAKIELQDKRIAELEKQVGYTKTIAYSECNNCKRKSGAY